jgi:hypothetical protein
LNENYPSAGSVVRNVADLRTGYRTLEEVGKFRIVALATPFFAGYRYWVVNEKGFLWEPAETEEAARNYLKSEEAIDYQNS